MNPSLTKQTTTDQRPLWDLILSTLSYKAVLVAHALKLFPLLAERPRTLPEVCEALKLERRPASALLSACAAVGLLGVRDDSYSLTPLAADYLLESSPTYFGGFLEMLTANDDFTSFASLKQAVLTNKSQVYQGEEVFRSHEAQAALARAITLGMHGHSAAAAFAWPERIDLSGHQMMLDVGGGSGIHSIAALRAFPQLQATVYDLPPVCQVATEFAAQYSLSDRLHTQTGDWWQDPFPSADLHFYADIYHDWTPEKCLFLTKKSFESLPSGGRIILHEMLYNDEKTGPASTAAYSVAMLLWTEGQQYSGREMTAMLTEAGFTDIEIKPAFAYWSLVTGRKP